uniref:Uncharacterized protein n=1 Tax=Knipowitschia caucasica TaxID=637954 RepID=A0AAV2LYN8_KNICA
MALLTRGDKSRSEIDVLKNLPSPTAENPSRATRASTQRLKAISSDFPSLHNEKRSETLSKPRAQSERTHRALPHALTGGGRYLKGVWSGGGTAWVKGWLAL